MADVLADRAAGGSGVHITDSSGLTGLAEYRNGGLFVDSGVLVPQRPRRLLATMRCRIPLVVEWRALTVALLDEIAPRSGAARAVTRSELPLARVLEGGTWARGPPDRTREAPGGGPPISCRSDGTVF